jgi:mono/diheme cytochrome c family protein
MIKNSIFFLVILSFLTACDSQEEIKRKQYIAEGLQLYTVHCANCHQADGSGLGKLYPPLKGSDYLLANKETIMCGMRNGMKDSLIVNGKTYTHAMPPNVKLTAMEVAEITTFVYNTWGNETSITTTKTAEAVLEKCLYKAPIE